MFRRLFGGNALPSDQDVADGGEPSHIQIAITRKMEQNPQFDYLWRVELPEIDMTPLGQPDPRLLNDPNSFLTEEDLEEIPSVPDISDINHRVYEITVPYTTFDTQKSIDRGSYRYSAAHADIGNITMTIDEMEDGLTLLYLLAWQKMMKNPDGTMNPPRFYKRPIKFIRMGASKVDLQFSTYLNYFPIEIQPMTNSYDGNGITQYQVIFAGDDVKHQDVNRTKIIQEVNAVEEEILMRQYKSSGFNLGSFDAQKQFAIFDRVSRIF